MTAEATGAAVSIRIPPTLRAQAGGAKAVEVQATTVWAAVDALIGRFPSLASVLVDGSGELSRFINVYRNEDDIRHLDGTATALRDGDTVVLLPAMAGGSGQCRCPLPERSPDGRAGVNALPGPLVHPW